MSSLLCGGRFCADRIANILAVKALWCNGLGWPKNKVLYILGRWPRNRDRGCLIHQRGLDVTRWSSAAIEEHDRDLEGNSFREVNICCTSKPNPRPLLISKCGLSVSDSCSCILGSRLQLVNGITDFSINFLGSIGKIVSGFYLIPSSISHVASGLRLHFRVIDQPVCLGTAAYHLVKLPSKNYSSKDSNGQGVASQSNHRSLETGHSFVYIFLGLFEFLFGCWLCWREVFNGICGDNLLTFALLGLSVLTIVHGAFTVISEGSKIVHKNT